MSEIIAGVAGMVALFAMLALRVPVGMTLLAIGFFGIASLSGWKPAMATMTSTAFSMSSNYSLMVIPMFLMMGNIATTSGLSRRLFDAAYAWVGSFRGGLASATVLGCASFAAVSGSSVATAVTIGQVALPEMRRFRYLPKLATGVVAAGGTLGILIPPSAPFVVYALLTDQSIGRLFIAGILPGILLTVMFILTVTILAWRRPEIAPPGPHIPFADKLRALGGSSPLIAVILISIGGIYLGIFTPVEASGIGAFLTAAIALGARLLTFRQLIPVLVESVRATAMLFMIVIGASVFGPFLSLSHIPTLVGESMATLNFGVTGTLVMILAVMIVLGTFLESFSMLVIAMPIFFPIIVKLGIDPIWFGVLIVVTVEMGLITPPVGLNVYVIKGLAPDVPMGQIFEGIIPFLFAMLITLVILVAFPAISLWLPNSMFN
jgi:tripartite ATP-independent transporter DctM subunit